MFTPEHVLSTLLEQSILEHCDTLPSSDDDLFLAGLDSIALMHLILHLETEYGIKINPEEMNRENFSTARKLASFLNQKAPASQA